MNTCSKKREATVHANVLKLRPRTADVHHCFIQPLCLSDGWNVASGGKKNKEENTQQETDMKEWGCEKLRYLSCLESLSFKRNRCLPIRWYGHVYGYFTVYKDEKSFEVGWSIRVFTIHEHFVLNTGNKKRMRFSLTKFTSKKVTPLVLQHATITPLLPRTSLLSDYLCNRVGWKLLFNKNSQCYNFVYL